MCVEFANAERTAIVRRGEGTFSAGRLQKERDDDRATDCRAGLTTGVKHGDAARAMNEASL